MYSFLKFLAIFSASAFAGSCEIPTLAGVQVQTQSIGKAAMYLYASNPTVSSNDARLGMSLTLGCSEMNGEISMLNFGITLMLVGGEGSNTRSVSAKTENGEFVFDAISMDANGNELVNSQLNDRTSLAFAAISGSNSWSIKTIGDLKWKGEFQKSEQLQNFNKMAIKLMSRKMGQ